ncbi:MAG: polyprenyl synthetase family protein [candidate division WOR-3 bacterium]
MKKSENFLNEIREKYKNYLKLLEIKIKQVFEEKVLIPDFITKGKRLRALSFMIILKNYNLLNEITLNIAISIELLHASSLIHDDIIDNEEFRREYPTLNKFYGNSVAVLSGDYVFIKSLEFANKFQNFQIIDEFIKTSKNMVKGELKEELYPKEEKLKEETYIEIISDKTASLFEYAFSSSAIILNHDINYFRELGKLLGIAYQIIDDCEDFFEDIKKGKITLPLIYLYKFDSNALMFLNDFNYLKEKIITSKAIENSIEFALNYLNKFQELLPKNLKEDFESYINYLKHRAFENIYTLKSL